MLQLKRWLLATFLSLTTVALALPIPVDLALADKRSCVLFDNGHVKCFGDNENGRLGLGDTEHRGDDPNEMGADLPFIDFGNRTVKDIAAGSKHMCVLLDTPTSQGVNEVVCFGTAIMGLQQPLGRGFPAGTCTVVLNNNVGDEPGEMGNALRAVPLGDEASAISINCGELHCCVVFRKTEGSKEIKCWGLNSRRRLGFPEIGAGIYGDTCATSVSEDLCIPKVNIDNGLEVIQVTGGTSHSCALFDNRKVKCWGSGPAVGLGTNVSSVLSVNPLIEVKDLSFVDFGDNITGVIDIAASYSDGNCAILNTTSGKRRMKCFGLNGANRLGVGFEKFPAGTESQFTLGTLGEAPGEMGNSLPFVPQNEDVEVHNVALGRRHSCMIFSQGNSQRRRLTCWGDAEDGRLGYESSVPIHEEVGKNGVTPAEVDLGEGKEAVKVAVGEAHTCVILNDDTVKCFGLNDLGQLGYGDTKIRGDTVGSMGDNLPVVELVNVCAPGSFRLSDLDLCTECTGDTFSALPDRPCQLCPEALSANSNNSGCECPVGSYREGNAITNGVVDGCYFKIIPGFQLDEVATVIISGVVAFLVVVVALCLGGRALRYGKNSGVFLMVLFASLDNTTDVLYILSEVFYSEILFWIAVATIGLSLVSYGAWLFRAGPKLWNFVHPPIYMYAIRFLWLLLGYFLHILFLLSIQSIRKRFIARIDGEQRDVAAEMLELETAEDGSREWVLDVNGMNKDRLWLFGRDCVQFAIQLSNTVATQRLSFVAIASISASAINLINFVWTVIYSKANGDSFYESTPTGCGRCELTTCT